MTLVAPELAALSRPQLIELVLRQRQQLAEQLALIAQLRAQLLEQAARLGTNSTNSSKPPSTDTPDVERPQKKPKSALKRGGQPGHKGHQRPLVPLSEVDKLVRCKPSHCHRCHAPLLGDDPNPSRHQQIELPPIRAYVTEAQLHELSCNCGAKTRADLPPGMGLSAFGPRLTAVVALLTGRFHLSKRLVRELLKDIAEIDLSPATVCQLEKNVSAALKIPVDEARQAVKQAVHEVAVLAAEPSEELPAAVPPTPWAPSSSETAASTPRQPSKPSAQASAVEAQTSQSLAAPSVPVGQAPVGQTPAAQTPVAQIPVAKTPVAQTPVAAPRPLRPTSIHLDESSWREAKKKAWIWVATTMNMALFFIDRSRGAQVAKNILGEGLFRIILVTDRWSGYNWVPTLLRQICWSHLLRDFQGWVDRNGDGAPLGAEILDLAYAMFHDWHRVKAGTLQRKTFQRNMRSRRLRVGVLLRAAQECTDGKVAGMAKEILKLESALWTFVRVEGVEPTNNRAERTIRQPVIWRGLCFGTDSVEGSRFVERILTATITLRLQERSVLDYLTAAVEADRRSIAPPSLLPL